MKNEKNQISIIGLGYVGLPLAIEFGKYFKTIGFDIDKKRIIQLKECIDITGEVNKKEFLLSKNLSFTFQKKEIKNSNIYIITVPTPINKKKLPDLSHLISATKLVSQFLKRDDIIIYESTVYPGVTEEICVPILEKISKLKFNADFCCGYSPERINPGDKIHNLKNIKKIVSGSNNKTLNRVNNLYKKIIKAGTYKVSSIKIAEAAKVIENSQRDLNIAFMNELSLIFSKLGIDTHEVLDAASTKWNFLPFSPGLVGGHCIGVDPYYLTYKARKIGYKPKLLLAGRKLNDNMGQYIAKRFIKKVSNNNKSINTKILIMGLTFKENCHDIRNSQAIKIYHYLKKQNMSVDLYDPWVDKNDAMNQYGVNMTLYPNKLYYDGIIIAVAHNIFKRLGVKKIENLCKKDINIFDVKNIFRKKEYLSL